VLNQNGILAVIISVAGRSYRLIGAIMGIHANGALIGSLSSGCVENDIVIHAQEVRKTGQVKMFVYAARSSYFDIQLPCGGGLEMLPVQIAQNISVLHTALKKSKAKTLFFALTLLSYRSHVILTRLGFPNR
jgi:xanthine dehydrogenase accessory factor